jgi:aminoglycoside phosphotransferase (APT) family kinase protein
VELSRTVIETGPAPDAGAGARWAADAALAAARAARGDGVVLAAPAEISASGFGPDAYTCRLAGDHPAPWDGPVVVRVHPPGRGGQALARELAWHRFCAAGGVAVPDVLGVEDGEAREVAAPDGPATLVMARGPAQSLIERMGENFTHIPQLIALMGEVQARLHGLPTAGAPPDAGLGPLDDLAARVAAAPDGGDTLAAALGWLTAHDRPGARRVVCHGDFQPSAVRLAGDDLAGAVVVNWSAARLAEPECDVALTQLMFWSAPYLAPGRAQRAMLKSVRDMLVDGYRSAYEAHAGLDETRMRWWAAFHALAWSVRLTAAGSGGGPGGSAAIPDPWDPVALVEHPDGYRKDLARRLAELTGS